jgi:pyruvate kinase
MSTIFAPSSFSLSLPAERGTRASEGPDAATAQRQDRRDLGPASSSPERLRALFDAGVDVFRCNFSHGTHDDHRKLFTAIRHVESETGRPIGILADMQGPKLRLGNFADGRSRSRRAPNSASTSTQPGDSDRAPLPHPEVFAALQPGNELLIDDGKVRLKVIDCGRDFAETDASSAACCRTTRASTSRTACCRSRR